MKFYSRRVFEHNNQSPALIIDAKEHVVGKLATFVAKHLLEGQKIIVINTENLVLTGPIERGIQRFKEYLNKRRLTKPEHGQKHHRSPSLFFQRAVRRMVPKRIVKGKRALSLLTIYESCPDDLINSDWMNCPKALLKNTADPIRKFYHLKNLLIKYGWKYSKETEEQNQKVEKLRSEMKQQKMLEREKENEIRKSDKFKRRVSELMAQIE